MGSLVQYKNESDMKNSMKMLINRPKWRWLCFNFKKSLSCLFLTTFYLKPKALFVMSASVRLMLALIEEPYQLHMACWKTLLSLFSHPDLITKGKTINCLLTANNTQIYRYWLLLWQYSKSQDVLQMHALIVISRNIPRHRGSLAVQQVFKFTCQRDML